MRVLVTGAAGFLGSHLVKFCLERGDRVLGVDNFSSSSRTSRHHRALLANHDYLFLEHDISQHSVINLTSGFQPELIFNFACPASPPRYQKIPIETLMTCVSGTKNMLDLAKKFNAKLIHASTSEVYGDPEISPQDESYRGNVNCWGPRSNYDEGKRAAETLVYEYKKLNVDARVVRIFNTYGPNMDPSDGRVISNFLVQAIKNEPLTVYGDGSQTRSFCYVDDLIDGIMKLSSLESHVDTPINIGNPNEFTISQLVKEISGVIQRHVDVVNMDLPIDDPLQRRPDIQLAFNVLNWKPNIDLSEGLKRTYTYFKEIIGGE